MLVKIIVWLVVGALAGTLTGMLVKRSKKGFGLLSNLGVGMIGALIGGGIFRLFSIDLGLGEIAISVEDIVAAIIGSLIFVLGIWIIQKRRKDKPAG